MRGSGSEILEVFTLEERAIKRAIAKYCPNIEDVNELYQDTFVKCFAAELTTAINNPRAFVFRVARNVAISESRKTGRKTTVAIEDSASESVIKDERDVQPDEQLESKRKLQVFLRALSTLPTDIQKTFVLRKIEGLKIAQIALRLDVSVSTVEKRIASATLHCAKHLRSKGYHLPQIGSGTRDALAKALMEVDQSN